VNDDELIRAASAASWQVWFAEGDSTGGADPVTAEVRFSPPAGSAASNLFGRDLQVVASDRNGSLWSLTVRPYQGGWVMSRGELELRAVGIGVPERIRAAGIEPPGHIVIGGES
jgi:hypothetical protein